MGKKIIKREEGQAMVEFALVLPLLILIVTLIIDFGWIFGNTIIAKNACREATRYLAANYYLDSTDTGPSIDGHMLPTDAQAKVVEIITDRAPTITSKSAILTIDGVSVKIDLSSDIKVLSPLIPAFGNKDTLLYKTSCEMKLEL